MNVNSGLSSLGFTHERTCPRTMSYEIGDVTFPEVPIPNYPRRKKLVKVKSWSADQRNVFGDKFADLWNVVYHHVGKRREIGPRTVVLRLSRFQKRTIVAFSWSGDVRARSANLANSEGNNRARFVAQQLTAQTVIFAFFLTDRFQRSFMWFLLSCVLCNCSH